MSINKIYLNGKNIISIYKTGNIDSVYDYIKRGDVIIIPEGNLWIKDFYEKYKNETKEQVKKFLDETIKKINYIETQMYVLNELIDENAKEKLNQELKFYYD